MDELECILKHEATAQPVSPDPRAQEKRLRLRENVVYIVAGVAFDGDKVLMIQEAKKSCRGSWYLPAGRMEPNETIVEAVKREVLEESGMIFEPEAVIVVECMSVYMWVRVTLIGKVTGGSLKTTAQADSESLQAGWFDRRELNSINLRARDILPLIETGWEWSAANSKYGGLPVLLGHISSSIRLILVARDNTELVVLARPGQGSTSFPTVDLNGFGMAMEREIKVCGYQGEYKVRGVLSLEHLGCPHGVHDGMCISVLLEAKTAELKDGGRGYQWCKINQKLEERVKEALRNCATLYQLA